MNKIVKIDYLSRVEGEGGVVVEIKDNRIAKLQMKIFEAPRFFEAFLKGRTPQDVIDFTARICGICPVAYQMSAVHAIEKIFGVAIDKPVHDLRRLLYCGEWIESHALHIYLLHGPDFYGIESAWANKDYLPYAKRGLGLKKLGNRILSVLGGRAVHPISVRVGGFYKVPEKKELAPLLQDLETAYEESMNGIKWAAGLKFTNDPMDIEYVSLIHTDEYPMNEGHVTSSKGIDLTMDKFLDGIQEYQVAHSTALHSGIKRGTSVSPYLAGPAARLNLNHDKLPQEIKVIMKNCSIELPLKNTQMGIIARSVELAYAIHEAMMIIRDYEKPDRPYKDFTPCHGEAVWITEAPRGILIHRYEFDEHGHVLNARIIPPTSQNLAMIETEIRHFVHSNTGLDTAAMKKGIEGIIRSYDPCISCSVHLVTVDSR